MAQNRYDYGIGIKGLLDLKDLKQQLKNNTLNIDFKFSSVANKEIAKLQKLANDLNNAFSKIGSNARGVSTSSGTSTIFGRNLKSDLEIASFEKSKQMLISQLQSKLNMGNRSGLFNVQNQQYSGIQLKSSYEKILTDAQKLNIQTDDYKVKLIKAQTELAKLNPAYQSLGKEAQKTYDKSDSLFGIVSKKILNATIYRAIFSIFNTINFAFDSIYKTTLEIDSELRNINKVLDLTIEQQDKLVSSANNLANAYSRTTIEVLKSFEYFAKSGFSYELIQQLTELSLKLQNVGDMSADAASQLIITANASYQLEGNVVKLNSVIDKMNAISNNSAVTVNNLAEAMKVAGAVAYSTGVSIDELLAMLSSVIESTQLSGRVIGNGMKTIILRLTNVNDTAEQANETISNTEKVLRNVGIEIRNTPNTFKPAMESLTELAGKWETLTDLEQRAITYNLAGVYRSNILESFLANINSYEEKLYISLNSVGSATRENELYMNSLEARIKKVTAAWEGFIVKFKASTVIKATVNSIAFALRNLDTAIKTFGGITLVFLTYKIIVFLKNANGLAGVVNKLVYSFTKSTTVIDQFGNSFQKLTLKTSVIIAAISLLVIGIMAIADASRKAREEQEQLLSNKLNETKEMVAQYGELNILIRQYSELQKQYAKTGEGAEQLRDLQEQLNAAYKLQASGIDLVNGKYDDQIKKLDELRRKQLENTLKSSEAGYIVAKGILENSTIGGIGAYKAGFFEDMGQGLGISDSKIENAMQKSGVNYWDYMKKYLATASSDATFSDIVKKMNINDYEKMLNETLESLIAKYNSGDTSTQDSISYIQVLLKNLENKTKESKEIVDEFINTRKQVAQMEVSSGLTKLQGQEKTSFDFLSGKLNMPDASDTSYNNYKNNLNSLISILDGVNASNVEDKWQKILGLNIGYTDQDKQDFLDYFTNVETQLSDTINKLNQPLSNLEKQVKEMEDIEDATRKIYDLRRDIAEKSGLTGEAYKNFAMSGDTTLLGSSKYAKKNDELNQLYDKYLADIKISEEQGLNNQETITQLYETQVALKEKELSILEKELDIEEKRKNLENLKNERSVRTFINGQWVYVNDYEAIEKQNEDINKDQSELDRLESELGTDTALANEEQKRLELADSITELKNAIGNEDIGVVKALQGFEDKLNNMEVSTILTEKIGTILTDIFALIPRLNDYVPNFNNVKPADLKNMNSESWTINGGVNVNGAVNFDTIVKEAKNRVHFVTQGTE